MKAKIVEDKYLQVDYYHLPDGDPVAEARCLGYDHFKSLPCFVECKDHLLKKTGWNSDRYIAYYKLAGVIARKAILAK